MSAVGQGDSNLQHQVIMSWVQARMAVNSSSATSELLSPEQKTMKVQAAANEMVSAAVCLTLLSS